MRRSHRGWVDQVLTISKLKLWSINYYIDTASAAETASRDLARAGGGLGEYYSEHETRTPTWLLTGDTHTVATLVGLTDAQRAGGETDAELAARWLDDGITPNGARGRAFGARLGVNPAAPRQRPPAGRRGSGHGCGVPQGVRGTTTPSRATMKLAPPRALTEGRVYRRVEHACQDRDVVERLEAEHRVFDGLSAVGFDH
jgi:hypothetical protein